jgi:hypothetical protein
MAREFTVGGPTIGDRLRSDLVSRGWPPSTPSRTGSQAGGHGEVRPTDPLARARAIPTGMTPQGREAIEIMAFLTDCRWRSDLGQQRQRCENLR